jgi:hypothetical protein
MAGELLLSTLRHVWSTLAALKINAALMGGIAVAAWHHLRNTRDVDLLVGVEPGDEPGFIRQLTAAGIRPLHDPPALRVGGSRILQTTYAPPSRFLDIRVDLFIAESEFHQRALVRRLAITMPGMDESVFILTCEDLILFKLLAGRILDRADCAYLLRANQDALDLVYLKEWTTKLNVEKELREAWQEAFGKQSSPPD